MNKTALIDGDVLVYRAAYKAQKTFHWGDGIYTPIADLKEARSHYESSLREVTKSANCTGYIVVFSDPNGKTFRHVLYDDYKKSRHSPANAKPMVFNPLRKDLIAEGCSYKAMLEGDDVLGILQTSMKNTVICTIDKDLRTIPGLHYNFDKKTHSCVTPEEANRFFLTQALAGDPTDGIPGIPGVGMKTAAKILEKNGYTFETVAAAYKKADLSEAVALQMARLVKILDVSLYDEENQTPILWSPAR
jgi:5'-3' exonuclease